MNKVPEEGKPKSKFLVFLIAIFLGPVGIHNFYIGRWKRGFIQFGLVFLTFGAGIVVTIPWAWIEAIGILVGKYSMEPKKREQIVQNQELHHSQKIEISARKEYLIAVLLLLPLLLISIPFSGIPILFAVLFYFLGGGLWNVVTRIFIKSVLPLYATIFSGGKKFLIRFSEYTIPPTQTLPELFRANRKLSVTAILVLFFLISLIAQSNLSMVTEGNIPDAVVCDDGTIDLFGLCDDGSDGVVCDSDCVLDNTTALTRVGQAYGSWEIYALLFFAPFVTILAAPLLVLKMSSLSIVDKKTRSMSPIGEKATDLTNVAAGAGSFVLFFQTAWRISSAASENGNRIEGFGIVAQILIFTCILVFAFYPFVWLPMLKFTKSFESHVLLLDNSLVESRGIEVHQLTYENNELRIAPVHQTGQQNLFNSEEPINNEVQSNSLEHVETTLIDHGPPLDAISNNRDEHGFEWIVHEGNNYYRKSGTTGQWMKYEN
jgi:TM2 domain-containing membrane protein YozV